MARPSILARLDAAGLIGRKRRPLADIEADIATAQRRLTSLKMERKALLASLKAKLQHMDPTYQAKFREGRVQAMRDPERGARWKERWRENAKARGWMLPEMNAEQRRAYNRMLRKGVVRGEALQVALQ